MWRGMRRLTLFMNSEAIVDANIKPHIQMEFTNNLNSNSNSNNLNYLNYLMNESMERFSKSTADLSICFQKKMFHLGQLFIL